ncbi:hypothetical protein [Rathayibacter soli]|uniref:hypothetical protein n=1 Tax=Rathayibacter soli TaxID=3144168 RepID=UPI0027E58043|nr:hypothetical protein [Glaciibacter superstes]
MTSDLDSTSGSDSGGESSIERRRRRIFRVQIWAGTGCYLLASFALYQWGHGSSPWSIIWAVLPLLFFAWNVVVIVLRMRQLDEYQIKLLFPPLAVGFTVAMFAAVTLGTLSAAGFAVPNGGWPVAIIGMVAWGFTTLVTGAPEA